MNAPPPEFRRLKRQRMVQNFAAATDVYSSGYVGLAAGYLGLAADNGTFVQDSGLAHLNEVPGPRAVSMTAD